MRLKKILDFHPIYSKQPTYAHSKCGLKSIYYVLGVYSFDLFRYQMTTYKNTLLPCHATLARFTWHLCQKSNCDANELRKEANKRADAGREERSAKCGRDKTAKTMENFERISFLLISDSSINDSLVDNHKYVRLSLMIALPFNFILD